MVVGKTVPTAAPARGRIVMRPEPSGDALKLLLLRRVVAAVGSGEDDRKVSGFIGLSFLIGVRFL